MISLFIIYPCYFTTTNQYNKLSITENVLEFYVDDVVVRGSTTTNEQRKATENLSARQVAPSNTHRKKDR